MLSCSATLALKSMIINILLIIIDFRARVALQSRTSHEQSRGGSRISEKGGLLINKRGAGAGGVTPSAQLGGLGERCKLPQRGLGRSPRRQRFFIISCSKHYIKLRAKTETVYIFHESNSSEIYMYDYKNCWIYVLQSDA